MSKKVRVGVIGMGIGQDNAQGFVDNPRCEVVALCDLVEEKMRSFAADLPGEQKLFTDYKAMCRDADIDAVFVGTPNQFHVPIALEAIRRDKHVMVTKPLADNDRSAAKLVDAADRSGVVDMMSLNHRFSPTGLWMREQASKGLFGDLYFARARSVRRNGIPDWNLGFIQEGGGACRDMGVHMLDLTWAILGKPDPISVAGVSGAMFGPRGLGYQASVPRKFWKQYAADDYAGGLVRFDGGAAVQVESFWASHQPDEIQVELFGTQAGARLYPPVVYTTVDGVEQDTSIGLENRGEQAWRNVASHFIDCILDGTPCVAPLSDGLKVQRMLEALLKSAAQGREVRV